MFRRRGMRAGRRLPGRRNPLRRWVPILVPSPQPKPGPVEPIEEAPQTPPRLPAVCPFCGAPLHTEPLEWIEARRARCAYCGSAVEASE